MITTLNASVTEAVGESADSGGLFTAMLDRFGLLGGVDLALPVDASAAEQYAVVASTRERAGRPISGFDALIAAVCRAHGATLATRSLSDFNGTGIETLDPWS